MKKNLLSVFMLLFAFSVKAQWSSMSIVNHSSCDYNVHLFATYDIYQNCNYENGTICVPAGGTLTAPSYWQWACSVSPFVTGPSVPEAPSTWAPLPTCLGVGTTATPWGSGTNEFDWRGALVWPCGTFPTPPGAQAPHPCGFAHFVGDGFCGPQNPMPPLHIWVENALTGDITLDLY